MKIEHALSAVSRRALPSVDFSGDWKNELDSTMTLQVKGGAVSGDYRSIVSSTNQPIHGTVSGYAAQDLLVFNVAFDGGASIGTWAGHMVIENGNQVIETQWLLPSHVDSDQDPTQLWQSLLVGSDRFSRPRK